MSQRSREDSWPQYRAHVLGAVLLALNFGSTESVVLGKTVFFVTACHGMVGNTRRTRGEDPAPVDIAARLALAPFTFAGHREITATDRDDRWAHELNLKFGIRGSFGCPGGGREIFVYCSTKPMQLGPDEKSLLYLGATYATAPLQQLAPPYLERITKSAALTARELAVLRALLLGKRIADIGKDLETWVF